MMYEIYYKQIRREVDRCIDNIIIIDGQKKTLHDSLKFCMHLKYPKIEQRKLLYYLKTTCLEIFDFFQSNIFLILKQYTPEGRVLKFT